MKKTIFLLLALFVSSVSVGATNIYKDSYTTEDKDGIWTFTGVNNNFEVNSSTPDTVTTAETSRIFAATSDATLGKGRVFELPYATTSGLSFIFINANRGAGANTYCTVKPKNTDKFVGEGVFTIGDKLVSSTSTATYATVRVISDGSNSWYYYTIRGFWENGGASY